MKKYIFFIISVFFVSVISPSLHVFPFTENKYTIIIDVNELTLSLIDSTTYTTLKKYPVAIGDKLTPSPIGIWHIKSKALMKGPYGGYWLGLDAPWDTFGIHGTSRPSSIGSMSSGGCIRMYNENIKELFFLVDYNTTVIVTAGPNFRFSQYVRIIKPNYRGTDVYEIQRRLKDLGYYTGNVNGIYEYSLEFPVLKYKKEHSLPGDTEIDSKFLDSIGLLKFD